MKSWRKVLFIHILIFLIFGLIGLIAQSDFAYVIAGIFGILTVFIIYFIPTFIASERKHKNEGAIGILNFFVGWTFIGWVICLVWAYTNEKSTNVIKDSNNKYEDLERIQKLKDNGTISEEEFNMEKNKILNK